MIEVAVYNTQGQEVDKLSVDESALGGKIRYSLLKQAIVMYHANKRVGTAATKDRGMVAGSGRKLYRQKGTGFARAGPAEQTNVWAAEWRLQKSPGTSGKPCLKSKED